MIRPVYVPVLKGKPGEMVGMGSVATDVRNACMPLVELMPRNPKQPQSVDHHVYRFCDLIRKHLPLGQLYVDMFGVLPDDVTTEGVNAVCHGFRLLQAFQRTVTPVYGLERNDEIWPELGRIANSFGAGFAFRLSKDDLSQSQLDDVWSQIIQHSAELGLNEGDLDLILDLKSISQSDRAFLADQVITFLYHNPRIAHYRSVVIVGSSTLRDVSSIEKEDLLEVIRNELHLWATLWLDMPDLVKPIFGDYGIVHPDFTDQGSSEHMNAKIRYTVADRTVYFRGHGLHKPTKDYNQYHTLANRVLSDGRFQGREFSLGDAFLSNCAHRHIKPGTPQRWVVADMNHHVTYTARQVQRLERRFLDREALPDFRLALSEL